MNKLTNLQLTSVNSAFGSSALENQNNLKVNAYILQQLQQGKNLQQRLEQIKANVATNPSNFLAEFYD